MVAGHLAAINFTQSGSKKGRQQSGEWRNKEWGSQLCHAILAPLSLSPCATPGVSHPSSLSLVQSQWCMTTITEHNDSSARNLYFTARPRRRKTCGGKGEETKLLGAEGGKLKGGKSVWRRRRKMMCLTISGCGGGRWGRWRRRRENSESSGP